MTVSAGSAHRAAVTHDLARLARTCAASRDVDGAVERAQHAVAHAKAWRSYSNMLAEHIVWAVTRRQRPALGMYNVAVVLVGEMLRRHP